jgi:hypothetical protein
MADGDRAEAADLTEVLALPEAVVALKAVTQRPVTCFAVAACRLRATAELRRS